MYQHRRAVYTRHWSGADSQARELASALDEMRGAAMSLPGGSYSVETIQQMSAALETEAEKRR